VLFKARGLKVLLLPVRFFHRDVPHSTALPQDEEIIVGDSDAHFDDKKSTFAFSSA
jgi:hypothetical protein